MDADIISTTLSSSSGAVSEVIMKAIDHKDSQYSRVDDYLVQQLLANGEITSEDQKVAARILLIPKMHRKIKNISKILKQADTAYNDYYMNNGEADSPSDDWVDYFTDRASTVSDERVQTIWSLILAKEVSNNGLFKKVMLDRIALLDRDTAEAFGALCRLTFQFVIKDGAGYTVPMYLRDDELKKMIKQRRISTQTVVEYQHERPPEYEMELLQEIGLVRLSDDYDENEIFEPTSFGFTVYIDDNDIYSGHSYYEDDADWHNYVPTGQAYYTYIGKALCQAIRARYKASPRLRPLVDAYYNYQETIRL